MATRLSLQDVTPALAGGARDVTRAYVADLLSDALARAPEGGVLVTVQTHLNVVAVAAHAGLAAVIFANGRVPEPGVRARAEAERIRLFVARETAFDVVGRLYAEGLRGGRM